MTERKRVYEELVAARDTAEQANRAKSQFLANMSHELRTPLNAVIGYSELLMDECRDRALEDLVPDLERIRSSGNHLLRLVEDVLDLSKIEAGRMQVQNELFDVAGAIRDVVAMVRPAADRNGNRLSVEADTTLGRICADEAKFRQSLLNLMSNACKFTEGGVVSVSAARTVAHGAEWLHVRVADTGIGIASEHLSKLFLSFSQADGTVTRRYGGTGLGLAITRRFCQMMGGDVSVQTELGCGSTFTITLPAQPAQSLEGVGA
jgi:signal transduction histidine kinase